MAIRSRSRSPDTRRETADLLRQAQAQPGVQAVLQVFRGWQAFEKASRPYVEAMEDKPLITASDTSTPIHW